MSAMSGLSESVTAAAAKVLSADSSGEGAAEEGSPAAQPEYEYGYGSNGLTKEEEDMSDAERISYLRERGIQIELSPSEQAKAEAKKKKAAGPSTGDLVPCFKYVKIPCDGSPLEELFAMLPLAEGGLVPAGDQLPELVRPNFAGRNHGISEEVLGEHARATLGEDAAKLTPRAFTQATLNGSVETFALVRPAAVNRHAGVYMYLDEIGVLKELPANPRGNAIAAACGHAGVSFFGDLFVGRVCTQPAPMRNGDFVVADMDSSAEWIVTAPAENYQYSLGMKEVEAALNAKDNAQHVKMGGFEEGALPGGEDAGGKYHWTQSKEDVEVSVPLPLGTRAKDLSVTIKRSAIKVAMKSGDKAVLLDVPKLNGQVDVDDSTWTVDNAAGSHTDGQARLVLTLLKGGAGSIWRMLKADAEEVGH